MQAQLIVIDAQGVALGHAASVAVADEAQARHRKQVQAHHKAAGRGVGGAGLHLEHAQVTFGQLADYLATQLLQAGIVGFNLQGFVFAIEEIKGESRAVKSVFQQDIAPGRLLNGDGGHLLQVLVIQVEQVVVVFAVGFIPAGKHHIALHLVAIINGRERRSKT